MSTSRLFPERGARYRFLLADAYLGIVAALDAFQTAEFERDVELEYLSSDIDFSDAVSCDCAFLELILP